MTLITLLTDFGLRDTYVGQMKAAILAIAPQAALVDLSHEVPAQDVQAGAFLLWSAVEACPPGSIHLAVVDPGVGSARRAIAAQSARGDVFVGPDNGLLRPAIEHLGGGSLAVELSEPRYWRSPIAHTFHGRDLFGPVAAHLSADVPIERLGRPIGDLVDLVLPVPHGLDGEVVHVDTYGNLITNLPSSSLPEHFQVRVGQHVVLQAPHYAAARAGTLLALIGSAGLLEISVGNASAAALTGASRGSAVLVEPVL